MQSGSEDAAEDVVGEDEEEEARCKAAMEVEKRVYKDSFQVTYSNLLTRGIVADVYRMAVWVPLGTLQGLAWQRGVHWFHKLPTSVSRRCVSKHMKV